MFLTHLYGGMDEPELKIIDVFVCNLRKKLADALGSEDCYIETVWGRGYVLRDPEGDKLDDLSQGHPTAPGVEAGGSPSTRFQQVAR